MANVFESLKTIIVDYFRKDKKGISNSKENKENNEDYEQIKRENFEKEEENVSLMMDETNRVKIIKSMNVEKSYNAINVFSAKQLLYVYGFFGVFVIIFMLACAYFNHNESIFSEIGAGVHKAKFITLFDLPKINQIVFHLLNTCVGGIGLVIVISVYMSLKMKYSSRRCSTFQFAKLYVSISYGVLSSLLHILYGSMFFIDGIDKLNSFFTTELNITLYQFIFLIELFFTILFGIFTSFIIRSLGTKPAYALNTTEINNETADSKWLNYKVLNVMYLIFFSFSYIFIILHSNDVILKTVHYAALSTNYAYLLAILPYLLYFMNISMYLTFYEELKNTNVSLVNAGEKVEFEKNNRNML